MKRIEPFVLSAMLLAVAYPMYANQVQYVPAGRMWITVYGDSTCVPMLYSHDPAVPHPEINHVVIYPSNGTREVLPLGQTLQAAAQMSGVTATTMIVGLQYLFQVDADEHQLEEAVQVWVHPHWYVGDLSDSTAQHPRPRVSSITFLDSLLVEIVRNNPQLEAISVMGESAGGKLVHRWAAGTRLFEEMELPPIVWVTVNNGNWLYMDAHRFSIDDQFVIPGPMNQSFVPKWDDYPYGVQLLNEYCTPTGADYIVSHYPERWCYYFIGELDNGLNSDDKPMNMQGMNNIMRHVAYWEHLHYFYGDAIDERQQMIIMEGMDHDGHAIIRTPECRFALFEFIPGQDVVDEQGSPELPRRVELQTYPNPFNPAAVVKLTLPKSGEVKVQVFNLMGRHVMTLADETLSAGTHLFTLDGSTLASGVYFVQVSAPGQTLETKKLTLLK